MKNIPIIAILLFAFAAFASCAFLVFQYKYEKLQHDLKKEKEKYCALESELSRCKLESDTLKKNIVDCINETKSIKCKYGVLKGLSVKYTSLVGNIVSSPDQCNAAERLHGVEPVRIELEIEARCEIQEDR